MSTSVDNNATKRTRIPSSAMRERVLAAAGKAFSRAGYDSLGIREIAVEAGTDPAIVMRLFGSKAGLFTQLAQQAFADEPIFAGPLEELGKRLARHLMQEPTTPTTEGTDDFQLLLRSATSLVAAPILSAALHKALIEPLGERIGGKQGAPRAALVVAQVMGFATLRFGLGSPAIEAGDRASTTRLLAQAIQRCVDQGA